tara:strand:+ start:208 stop:762 length:555 start_codon:yes stop_codon:yes gene_type:complete
MIEYRKIAGEISVDRGGGVLEGYAIRYNSESRPIATRGGSFVETIAPGAFDRSLASSDNISLHWNHRADDLPLATTRGGSLSLTSDSIGLRFRAELAETNLGRDVHRLLASGDLDGSMSFGFYVNKDGDTWTKDRSSRRITSGRIQEISVVDRGAYKAAVSSLTTTPRRRAALLRLGELRPCKT